MKESTFRSIVVKLLASLGAFAVENVVGNGTPDVHCILGWIELKIAEGSTMIGARASVEMRSAQKIWHRRWRRRGGISFVLIYVDGSWILCDGQWSADKLGDCTWKELIDNSIGAWHTRPSAEDFISALERGHLR